MDASILVPAGHSLMAPLTQFCRILCLLCSGMAIVARSVAAAESPSVKSAHDAVEYERRPYEVRLLLACAPLSASATVQDTTVREIQQAALRCVGELWSLTTIPVSWLSLPSRTGLERINKGSLTQHHPEGAPDVWFAAVVESLAVGKRVSVRSWQFDVQLETEIASVDVMDDRDLPIEILKLCRTLMRPMGIVEQVDNKDVRIRLRGGELNPPDPSFAQLQPGDLMVPFLAYRNREQVIEKLQPIPWTYITVKDVNGSVVRGNVESGLRLALGGKKRGRIDTLVVAVRPQFSQTQLQLVKQGRTPLPLAAHRVEVRSEAMIPRATPEDPDVDPGSTLLADELTNRQGYLEVSRFPEKTLVWLFVYSGQNLLARVPFIPGVAAHTRLEVPDDSTRFAAEADLQMLQGEVIDAVALRNTAISTIRAAASKDDWATVNQKLALLKQQESSTKLIERLLAVRVAGVAAAQANKDKSAQARINRMCDEAVTLIKTHLSDDKIRQLSEEMEALQAQEKDSDTEQ
ncbi:hypothetical protein [Schlesneria sp. DSM 10557]|uniref:hypothetical protein n=1 Tax=Schlesneria sp. DSM 10557 TaxID=3044399 RepID=UPI0035A15F3A